MIESALIVSNTSKGVSFFIDILGAVPVKQIVAANSCGEARRLLLERNYDLVVINAMLQDESGESLSRHIASSGFSQVILVVKNEYFDAVSAICEDDGVLVISKPVDRAVFWSALKLAASAQSRLKRAQAENNKLKQKIEDIRIIDRAKCLLIAHLNISEQDAHRYIEKQAMNMRQSKRMIAEGILKAYENT